MQGSDIILSMDRDEYERMLTKSAKSEIVRGYIYRTNMFLLSTLSWHDIKVNTEYGKDWDYSSNISFKIAKIYKLDAQYCAKLMSEEINNMTTIFSRIEAKSGFLNFTISNEELIKCMMEIVYNGQKLQSS